MKALSIKSLSFAWPGAASPLLDIPSLDVLSGEHLLLRGPSGCGKSTLIAAIAGGVDVGPGMLTVCGTDIGALRGKDRDRFRADHQGIICQLFNLVPYLNAIDNAKLPCRFSRRRRRAAGNPTREARRLLAAMGLSDKRLLRAPATELSVGQQQSVAAARALIGRPQLILADEPTSALDPDTRDAFLELLLAECRIADGTLICVSHDPALDHCFDRCLDFSTLHRAGKEEPC